MIVNRVIYILTLVCALIFYTFYPPWFSWYLLVLVLLLLPLDLLISLPGLMSKRLIMSVPYFLEKDEPAAGRLSAYHLKSFPVRCIYAKVHITGDGFFRKVKLKCTAQQGNFTELKIDTSQSGVTVFEVKKASVISLLGIFSLPLRQKTRQAVLILPKPVKPKNSVSLQQGINLRPKPGGGFSEEHDLREYRQGDPVRSIHWKVSAKFDTLIIREPLELPPHSRLVHIMPWKNAAERDLILGCLRWVCEYLLKRKMPFYARYGDELEITEIKHESEMAAYLHYVLDKTVHRFAVPEQVPTRFSWIYRIDAGSGSL